MELSDLLRFAALQAGNEGRSFRWRDVGATCLDLYFRVCEPPIEGTTCISGAIVLHPSLTLLWNVKVSGKPYRRFYVAFPLPQNSSD